MSFTNYETKEPVEPRVLTDAEKKAITDDFIAGKTITEIKHSRFIPTNLIKQSFAHKKETEKLVIQLMNKQILITPAEYDEEGIQTVEAVYNEQPTTITKLKSEMAKLKDCSILNYNIDKIIKTATTAGTFTAFKNCF